jgi:hypothetical protein
MGTRITVGEYEIVKDTDLIGDGDTVFKQRLCWGHAQRIADGRTLDPSCPMDTTKHPAFPHSQHDPLNCEPTYSNEIYPSYPAWGNFIRDIGIEVLECDGGDKCVIITEELLSSIEEAKATDKFNQARLDWLRWWARWALENCKEPTIYIE